MQVIYLASPVVHWLTLWPRNPQVAGSIPVEDGQGYELFGEIALTNQHFSFAEEHIHGLNSNLQIRRTMTYFVT